DSKSHKVVRSRDVTFNEDSIYGAKAATDSSNLTKPNQKDQMVLEGSPENLENKSIVTEHGLSSEFSQSPGGSSDTSEGSKNSESFEDSRRSDEEYSKDGASSEEGGSKTPHERRHHKDYECSRLKKSRMARKGSDMAEFNKPKWWFSLVFEMKDRCSEKQVGDEREVEVLRSFSWPPSELITDDGVLPEKGRADYVVQIEWDRWSSDSRTCCAMYRWKTGFEGRIVRCKPNLTSVE
nr:hypothetical protein [Tanacetum cinerariifolium]